jgi:hypothetical protein
MINSLKICKYVLEFLKIAISLFCTDVFLKISQTLSDRLMGKSELVIFPSTAKALWLLNEYACDNRLSSVIGGALGLMPPSAGRLLLPVRGGGGGGGCAPTLLMRLQRC